MPCENCALWLTQSVTDYEDGSRIVNYASPDGKGRCDFLTSETPAAFHCNHHKQGDEHIEVKALKPGSPWHHSQWGECPDCKGVGWDCRRCAGTGRVLYYDDGYIGEEQTRRHPRENEGTKPPAPSCIECKSDLDPAWKACPNCGTKVDRPEAVRIASLEAGFVNGTQPQPRRRSQ